MDVSIVMFKADGSRRDFPIQRDKLVIGRKNTSDLRIPLSSVSRQHCEIRVEGDQVKMRDLGSSNGTFHNDTRVQEAVLAAGDKVSVGPVVFTLVIDGEPGEIEPVRTVLDDADGTDQSATVAPALDEPPREITTKDQAEQMPTGVEAGANSPIVDLDSDLGDGEDPIAALEALAAAEDEDDEDDRLPSIELLELDDDDDR